MTAVVDIPQQLDYDAEFKLTKRVALRKPKESDFSISSHVTNYNGSQCRVTFILQGGSGVSPNSVKWTGFGGQARLISSNNYQAQFRVNKNQIINLSAEISVCGSKLTRLSSATASCGAVSGGGGPIDFPIDEPIDPVDGPGDGGFVPYSQSPIIFPNPTNGSFKIAIANVAEDATEVSLQILDLSGKVVRSRQGISLEKPVLDVDYPNLESGTYLVKVTSRETVLYQGKLIRE